MIGLDGRLQVRTCAASWLSGRVSFRDGASPLAVYRLDKVLERLHLLEGLWSPSSTSTEVIRIIHA